MATLARTLKELVEPFCGRKTTQAERLVKAYKGEWYKVTWPIKDIENNNPINWFRSRKVSLQKITANCALYTGKRAQELFNRPIPKAWVCRRNSEPTDPRVSFRAR